MNSNLDYIIVGSGLAGICFSEYCINNNKKFIVINNHSQNSTTIAGGLYNPVVLKRFTSIWKAQDHLNTALPFFKNIEKKLKSNYLFEIPLHRKLFSIEEQNNWYVAADKPILSNFLSPDLIENQNQLINAPFKMGEVKYTGYVDTNKLKTDYIQYLTDNNNYIEETFDYTLLKIETKKVTYNNFIAQKIVFCEGFGNQNNPYFNNLPLDGTKGELLLIHAPELKINTIINSSIFILPIGNDFYKVGATYNWEQKDNTPTENAKNELITQLKELINCEFEIIEHYAGIRPTVKDRRPLVGVHHTYKNMFILNGLGTRGVLLGPYLADKLYNFIESNEALENEINIDRIYKKLNLL